MRAGERLLSCFATFPFNQSPVAQYLLFTFSKPTWDIALLGSLPNHLPPRLGGQSTPFPPKHTPTNQPTNQADNKLTLNHNWSNAGKQNYGHWKCTSQWLLVYTQDWLTPTTVHFRIFHLPKNQHTDSFFTQQPFLSSPRES